MTGVSGEFENSLLWGLKRLALYGELAQAEGSDPHVRYEAKCHAKVTLEELARQCRSVDTKPDQ